MKKIFAALFSVLLILMSGCTAGGNSSESTGSDEGDVQIPQIMFLKVYENWAWGKQQDLTVIDSDGKMYTHSFIGGYGDSSSEDDVEWVELSADDWYDRLVEIAESGEAVGSLSAVTKNRIRNNVKNFAEWDSLPMKEYPTQSYDYGSNVLCGICFGDDGEPMLVTLAVAGDVPRCRRSLKVKSFVNKLSMLNYFFT